MKRKLFSLLAMFLFAATAAFGQDKMEVKDANSNVLMQVNDEGTAGSITLPSLGAVPSVFTNKIYSIGGELYFNGVKLNTPWSLNGANIFFNSGNVGVGTDSPNSNAVLDIDAANNDKGVLLPRLTTAQRTAISGLGASEEGLIVYDETTDGFWFWNGSQWNELGSAAGDNLGNHTATQTLDLANNDITNGGTVTATTFVGDGSGLTNLPAGNGWSLTGNAGTTDGTNFIGTTDNVSLDFRINNSRGLRLQYGEYSGTPAPSIIGGGSLNQVTGGAVGATIAGGGLAPGTSPANKNTIVGGDFGTIGGGNQNQVLADYGTVSGGRLNTASGQYATVAGGYYNVAGGDRSFAAGSTARIDGAHNGTFLWSDDRSAFFYSAAGNEFAARATGGVRFVTAIDVSGNPTQTVSIDNTGTVTANAFVGDGSGLTGITGSGDDLGNHTATQTLDLANNDITNGGTVTAVAFVGDGSGLSGISGDNLGNHTATQTLNLNGNYLSGDGAQEGIFVDANGNVGLGTNSPTELLHVNDGNILVKGSNQSIIFSDARPGGTLPYGTLAFKNIDTNNSNTEYTGASIAVFNSGTDDGDLRFSTASDLTLNERMRVTENGDVGIGTTTPTTKLDVNGTVTATAFVGDGSGLSGLPSSPWSLNGSSVFYNSGQVGIGTAAPATKLEVEKASTPEIRLTDGRTESGGAAGNELGKLSWYTRDSSNPSGYEPVAAIEVVTDNTTVAPDGRIEFKNGTNDNGLSTSMTITASGNVGIGTTTPASKLEVSGTVTANAIAFPDGSVQTKASPATGIYTVGAGDFVAQSNTADVSVTTISPKGLGGTFVSTTGSNVVLLAPVHLPQGATVTKVTFYGFDQSATTDIEIYLVARTFYSGAAAGTMAGHTSNTSAGEYSATDESIFGPTIDNSQKTYFVFARGVGGTWDDQGLLAVNAVVIEYTMP